MDEDVVVIAPLWGVLCHPNSVIAPMAHKPPTKLGYECRKHFVGLGLVGDSDVLPHERDDGVQRLIEFEGEIGSVPEADNVGWYENVRSWHWKCKSFQMVISTCPYRQL